MKFLIVLAALVAVVAAAQQQTTPIPILKQINKHNEDGSYSYGYEAADGSFKIESKYPNGEVYGKYGYVDDSGKLREIEYGASRRGFEPAGNEINVAPPTLSQNNEAIRPLAPNEEDDGQYREDPSVYYQNEEFNTNNNKQVTTPFKYNQVTYNPPQQQQYQQPQPQPQQQYFQPQQQQQQQYYQPQQQQQQQYQAPVYQTTYRPAVEHGFLNQQSRSYQPVQKTYQPVQKTYQPQPQTNYAPVQPSYYNPAHANFNPFGGHPAQNFDVNSGSYSVSYK